MQYSRCRPHEVELEATPLCAVPIEKQHAETMRGKRHAFMAHANGSMLLEKGV